ncbi:hypothetical protein C3747_104g241c [Trypanosoma cruzi]|uniref:Uncharacterized protein n=3 Tax=Trypanosoma cruzi TaxID=5693 RepID=Q4DHE2_TRYCC|nr:hypothetical protein, conserved [Trypanosoma cruzi]ESS69161.1 hypothetical protein TCDM_14354 [Trypanosoma cruzi Dm28c]PBJ80924.1 hypothetical protein BCY84_01132 [Trypanosoma cruzi cruzi]EAN91951.1 hypothetical protein, conserved [Trypanosoma cruzi]KAF8286013.1 hypothetical protein TcBrA4_0027890 [Trypanosoma cruzi]PWU96708.1 hypothetical protein C4B63_18g1091c [Trypanosoma cruzi]|eukprot:XP_813802.1 hypothetical protein [Trypanosoma cruzi strain CL Brener]
MQENNIHMSYPNYVIVHRGSQMVFVALPAEAKWIEARLTYAALMNLDPQRTMLTPHFASMDKGTPPLCPDDSLIEWPASEALHTVAVEASPDGTWTALTSNLRPLESRRFELEKIPQAVSKYLTEVQQDVHPNA